MVQLNWFCHDVYFSSLEHFILGFILIETAAALVHYILPRSKEQRRLKQPLNIAVWYEVLPNLEFHE